MPDNMLKLKCTENVRCWMNEAPIYHIRKKPKALQIPQRFIFSCWSLIHNSPTNNTTTSRGRFLGHWVPPATTWACYIHPLFSEWQSEMWCFPKYTCLFSASQALWSTLPRVWGRFWFVECRTSLLWKFEETSKTLKEALTAEDYCSDQKCHKIWSSCDVEQPYLSLPLQVEFKEKNPSKLTGEVVDKLASRPNILLRNPSISAEIISSYWKAERERERACFKRSE
jgi:hypothetical protein